MTTLLLTALVALDVPPAPDASTVRAVWLADLHPDRVKAGPGMFVFVPGSRADDVTGHWCVEAAGAGDVLHVVSFAKGETDEGLDIAAPIVFEGEQVVIRHSAQGEFPAVGFLVCSAWCSWLTAIGHARAAQWERTRTD